nr:ATP-binding protein [Parvularcula dongshanensis]
MSTCDREPIRTPGSIQPHGLLFALQGEDFEVAQVSVNVSVRLGRSGSEVLGLPISALLGESVAHRLAAVLPLVPETVRQLGVLDVGGGPWAGVVHSADGLLILELEEVGRNESGSADRVYPELQPVVQELEAAVDAADVSAIVAREVRRISGFDRVLIYRFDEVWNGTVIAEARNERLPSYLDLRFPASDVPAQARELYRLNRLRLIPNAAYDPVPLLPSDNPLTGRPLDLSLSTLRSVSPVHVEYMKNMETPASMSISIVQDGRLWGLISCHHAEPRHVSPNIRVTCDFLGQIAAMQLGAKVRMAEAAQRVERQAIQARLLTHMAAVERFTDGLADQPEDLLALTQAAGAAIVTEETIYRVGTTPSEGTIRNLIGWLDEAQPHDEVFATEALGTVYTGADDLVATGSGVIAISISQIHRSYILWFRPEVERTVRWGGDPRKPVSGGSNDLRLHPRKSFETWKETVRLHAAPWSDAEVAAAASLRSAIISIVMRRAEELAELTQELQRSNKELEAFSYSVSHDLRAPFRHIVGYAELLKSTAGDTLDVRSHRYVETIIESALSAGKLVDDLLSFSQMGRTTLMPMGVDMNRLLDEVLRMLRPEMEGRQIAWTISRELAPAWGDPSMLRQVVQNLLSNALKYTRGEDGVRISVWSEQRPKETVYRVSDNGVGFEMAYVDKLFGVFQRLHRIEEFEGTGIGLANVRRIVERHGGWVHAEGAVGQGAVFSFGLPVRPGTEA